MRCCISANRLHQIICDIADRHWTRTTEGCRPFLGQHLPRLVSLRHLAFHGAAQLRQPDMLLLLAAAAALMPHLRSLHLVWLTAAH